MENLMFESKLATQGDLKTGPLLELDTTVGTAKPSVDKQPKGNSRFKLSMRPFYNFYRELVHYDAQRDFYAKHFYSKTDDYLHFRSMRRSDRFDILDIENSIYNFPWGWDTFKICLSTGNQCRIAEHCDREIVAYGILREGIGETHIVNLGVSKSRHGQGYGRRMLQHLIDTAKQTYAETLTLEVRPSNSAAIHLYEKMGFVQTSRIEDYYRSGDQPEDALIFTQTLTNELDNYSA